MTSYLFFWKGNSTPNNKALGGKNIHRAQLSLVLGLHLNVQNNRQDSLSHLKWTLGSYVGTLKIKAKTGPHSFLMVFKNNWTLGEGAKALAQPLHVALGTLPY